MLQRRIIPGLASALALMVLFTTTAHAEKCETIHFKRGESAGTVHGMALPDNVVCYEMSTGDSQMASLAITGNNCIFSIDGVVDAQDRYSFTTEKKTYKIRVGQLMRSITPEPFTLTISLR